MATIDVTENGVVFNDTSAAAANGDAIEDILENQASNGDTIDFPFGAGDVCYVEGNNPSSDGQRGIDITVADGLAQNLTIQGRTDANNEPVGEIKVPDSITGWHYLLEVSVGGGLTQTVKDLKWNYNQRGHNVSTGGSCIYYRDQNTGVTNDIQFTNCYLQGGYDVIFRALDVNGVVFDNCTFDYSETNHCLAVDQKNLSKSNAEGTPCRARNCLFLRAEQTINGGTAVNSSPGHIIIEDCVVDQCGSVFKVGNESGTDGMTTEIRRVRATNITDKGIYSVTSPDPSQTTLEDVIIESTGNGPGLDFSANHDAVVADGSIVVILNTGDDGIILRDSSQLQATNAELQVCGSASDAYRFDSDADSTWDVLTRNNNTDGVANFGSGTLTINSENVGTACQTDIAGVPTASEVGVGTTSSNGGETTTGGPITDAEADYYVDPVNGTNGASGTSVSNAVDSIYAFDEDGSISLSPGDTVALLEGTDTLSDRLSLSFIGEMTTTSPVKLGDPNVSRNGTPITFGTFETNTADYVLDGSNLSTNSTVVYQFKTNNVDFTGSVDSEVVIRGAPNHGMKLESPNEESQGGIYEYVRFEDYGNDSTSQGGNGIWVAEGYNGGVMRRCTYYDGSEPADSDGVYFGGPSGNRPGGWLFEYCIASYNCDDGFDFFRADSNNPCLLRFCVAHHNGRDQATWDSGNTDGTSGAWGDGNGFKCAGDSGGNMWVMYCVAYMNKGRNQGGAGDPNGSGFDDNGIPGQRYVGCTSAYNEEWGIRAATSDTISLNCVAYANGDGPEDGATSDENNSWDTAASVTDSDFESIDPTSDSFYVPVSGSDLVDAGVIVDGYTFDSDGYSSNPFTFDLANDPPVPVTESFEGNSPDLGYAETGTTPLADSSTSGGGGGGDTTTSLGFGGGRGGEFGGGLGGEFGGGK